MFFFSIGTLTFCTYLIKVSVLLYLIMWWHTLDLQEIGLHTVQPILAEGIHFITDQIIRPTALVGSNHKHVVPFEEEPPNQDADLDESQRSESDVGIEGVVTFEFPEGC
jgi:hypothetical protein